jgi:hypothetical protein
MRKSLLTLFVLTYAFVWHLAYAEPALPIVYSSAFITDANAPEIHAKAFIYDPNAAPIRASAFIQE